MCKRLVLAAAIAAGTLGPAAGLAQSDLFDPLGSGRASLPGPRYLTVSVTPSHTHVTPGQDFHLAVELTVADGWVFYSPAPGGNEDFAPKAASLAVQAGAFCVGEALWPADQPHSTTLGDRTITNHVYTGRAVAYVPVTAPLTADGPGEIAVIIDGQVCSDSEFKCIPVLAEARATVTVAPAAVANEAWTDEMAAGLPLAMPAGQLREKDETMAVGATAAGQLATWAGLGLAVLAGLIMNVMPCVLPVIPIRVLSVVELARQSRRRFVTVGLAFALGVASLFIGLAVANVVLRLAAGQVLDWGRHFQSAAFRVGMAMVVTAMAVNLFGVFTVLVPRRLAALEGRQTGQGHLASFGMGLMMAILATPCSFAILVLAFAWAQIQPLWLGSLAIVLIGVGMAAPHALLVAFPALVGRLPKPGRWMDLLKQAMGFVLLLVAVWLVGTLSEQTRVAWVTGYAVVLAFCLWMWGTWARYDWPAGKKVVLRLAGVVLAVAAGWWMLRPPRPLAVEFAPFNEQRIAQARNEGQTVLVDFTAAWCLSCKVVDAMIYDNAAVADELAGRGVLAMRGDVTSADAPANEMLYERFKGAPPLTVIFPPTGPAIRLEGKFSAADLLAALDDAEAKARD